MSQQQYALEKLQAIQTRILEAERASRRVTGSVTLIGASKKQSPALLMAFAEQGLKDVGENYLQEAIGKQIELGSTELKWHFIGQIQSNKTKLIAQHFSWAHGVDRLKIATRLAMQNPHPTPINLMIQLNLDSEDSKGGVSAAMAPKLANEIHEHLSALEAPAGGARLRGFMAIPRARKSIQDQKAVFARAKQTLTKTNRDFGLSLSELSMGMSSDLEAAIHEGATMVRIGTDLFGSRD